MNMRYVVPAIMEDYSSWIWIHLKCIRHFYTVLDTDSNMIISEQVTKLINWMFDNELVFGCVPESSFLLNEP